MSWEQTVRESLGQLNTHKLDAVLGVKIEYNYDYGADKIIGAAEFKVTYATEREIDCVLVISVRDFRRIQLPELFGDLFQFHELEIHDVSEQQLDGVNYQLRDYRSDFECDCEDVEITCVYDYVHNEIGDPIWNKEAM